MFITLLNAAPFSGRNHITMTKPDFQTKLRREIIQPRTPGPKSTDIAGLDENEFA
jgi:hypothetical protein